MLRELYLRIDDDVARTIAKIKRVDGSDLTLVLPKGSMVLSNVVNLKLLKKQIDLLGKNVSILTMDKQGQQRAMEAGFSLMTFEMMRQGIKPEKPKVPEDPIKPDSLKYFSEPIRVKDPLPEPIPEKPSYRPAAVPEAQKIFPIAPKKIEKIHRIENRNRGSWIAVVLLSIILLTIIGLFVLPNAEITVVAHTQPLVREMQITVDKNVALPDSKNLSLPGQLFDKDQSLTKGYTTNGKQNVGIKAAGNVQIYNYTGKILKFAAATTTLTVGTKLYHLQKDVSGIKPTKNFNGTKNVDPSSLTPPIAIVADQPGEEYNLPANTRFEIHNKVLGDAPQLLYAINTTPINGGITRFTSSITEADIEAARADLNNSLLSAVQQQLPNKAMSLVPSGAQVQNANTSFDKSVNDTAVHFEGTITGHVKALLFNNSDLENMVKQRIELTLDKNQKLSSELAKWTLVFKSLDLDKGVGVLSVTYQGKIVGKVSSNEIAAISRGKTPGDLREILLSDPRIDDLTVILKPFWANSIPSLSGRIKVNILTK